MRGPSARPIVIAAGGTGGHFYPAEALAATLIARGQRVVLMTDARASALKSDVFSGHEQFVLRGAGLAGRGAVRATKAVFSLAVGVFQARQALTHLRPAAIVGFGGYPCIAPVLAARTLSPQPIVVLHEQNAVSGRANRFLARGSDLLALGFAETARVPSNTPFAIVGNPVRPAIQALATDAPAVATQKFTLLVLGGSLGARIFSDVVPEALATLPHELRARIEVIQQCRPEDMARVSAAYQNATVAVDLATFFTDIADRLRTATLIISRAGASTCAEIAVAGRAAILVPLPTAIDDHQTANARALSGATIIAQTDFTPANLAALLEKMLSDPGSIERAARLVHNCGHPQAADDLADRVEQLITCAETLK